jgi:hypothetical protein
MSSNEKKVEVDTATSAVYKKTKPIKPWSIITAWYMVVLHFLCSVALVLAMIYGVDGYKALDGDGTPRHTNGKFTLRSGDITTLISAGTTIIGLILTSWTTTVTAQCVFALLEDPGLTVSQFSWIMGWNAPLFRFSGASGIVGLILLVTFPQQYIDPLINGAVNWGAALEEVGTVKVASGNPEADYILWGWYGSRLQDRQAAVRRAAGMANLAWATAATNGTSGGAQKTCRHVVNDDAQIPIMSLLDNVTMPCIVVNSITWPTAPASSLVQDIADISDQVTLTDTIPFSFVNYPGNAIIFDQSNTTLQLPYNDSLYNSDFFDLTDPIYPTAFRFSGEMTAIVLLGKHYIDAPFFTDGFGYPSPANNFTTESSGEQLDFTYLAINFTAGVILSANSTYISSSVVESNPLIQERDIIEAPWVHEALYLLPEVMSMVAIMNATSLPTWGNLENYTENLIRYSYQGAWDMLQRSFDTHSTSLVARIEDPRVQATVTRWRVYLWLGISLLLTASVVPLIVLIYDRERNLVIDGSLALLLTDPSGVLERDERGAGKYHLTNIKDAGKEENKITMQLQKHQEEGRFVLNRVPERKKGDRKFGYRQGNSGDEETSAF